MVDISKKRSTVTWYIIFVNDCCGLNPEMQCSLKLKATLFSWKPFLIRKYASVVHMFPNYNYFLHIYLATNVLLMKNCIYQNFALFHSEATRYLGTIRITLKKLFLIVFKVRLGRKVLWRPGHIGTSYATQNYLYIITKNIYMPLQHKFMQRFRC